MVSNKTLIWKKRTRFQFNIFSAPDNYFVNQYSTDENWTQPVPSVFSISTTSWNMFFY